MNIRARLKNSIKYGTYAVVGITPPLVGLAMCGDYGVNYVDTEVEKLQELCKQNGCRIEDGSAYCSSDTQLAKLINKDAANYAKQTATNKLSEHWPFIASVSCLFAYTAGAVVGFVKTPSVPMALPIPMVPVVALPSSTSGEPDDNSLPSSLELEEYSSYQLDPASSEGSDSFDENEHSDQIPLLKGYREMNMFVLSKEKKEDNKKILNVSVSSYSPV